MESTLWKWFHASPCHHRWFVLTPPCDLQLVQPCGRSSFELVRHELGVLFLRDVNHIKELLYFIKLVQEGLDVKVPTERRNLDLHPILVRTWVLSSPIWVGKGKSFSPVGIRISRSPRASPIGCPSIITFIFEMSLG